MSRNLPARFWFEAITAAVGLVLTGWDPDHGNGALEFALAFGLLAISAASAFAARREFQRASV
jgi:hypothetical protein